MHQTGCACPQAEAEHGLHADYDGPIAENGGQGQPGTGGPNKYQVGLLVLHLFMSMAWHLACLRMWLALERGASMS